jgi:ferrous iron transport protein A
MSSNEEASPKPLKLSELTQGERGVVRALNGDASFCDRLREMGFCEEAVVEKLTGHHTMLCQVCGTRIALNQRAAQHIEVDRLDEGRPS